MCEDMCMEILNETIWSFSFSFFLLLLYDLKFFCICAKRLKRKGYFFVHCLSALYSALVLSISLCIFVFRLGGKIPMSVADFIQMRQTKKKTKQTNINHICWSFEKTILKSFQSCIILFIQYPSNWRPSKTFLTHTVTNFDSSKLFGF